MNDDKTDELDIDHLIASLQDSNSSQNQNHGHDQRQSQPKLHPYPHPHPQPQPQPQPTRSGRIPQRPDPAQSNLNPLLDFLNFPDDSESDDPDFEPFPNPTSTSASHHHPLAHHSFQKTSSASSLDFSANLAWLSNPIGSSRSQHRPASELAIDEIGFDFSTLSDHPASTGIEHLDSLDPQPHLSRNPHRPVPSSTTIHSSDRSKAAQRSPSTNDHQIIPTKLSPLTQGEIAGVPFVNINLPDSDDSPEFLPPIPITHPISPRPSKRPRRDSNLNKHQPSSHLSNRDHRAPQPAHHLDPSSSRIDRRNQFNHDRPSKAPASTLNRYIAIAPSPSYTSSAPAIEGRAKTPRRRIIKQPSEDEFDTDDDNYHDQGNHDRPITNRQSPKPTLKKDGPMNSKPGPKPNKNHQPQTNAVDGPHNRQSMVDDFDLEDPVKRKRDAMRKTRERKKLYIVSLEDRCLELAEENARLREENTELIRESRENWKAKAKSLEIFRQLNQKIQQLEKERVTQERSKREDHSNRQVARRVEKIEEPEEMIKEAIGGELDSNQDDDEVRSASSSSVTILTDDQQLKSRIKNRNLQIDPNLHQGQGGNSKILHSATTVKTKINHDPQSKPVQLSKKAKLPYHPNVHRTLKPCTNSSTSISNPVPSSSSIFSSNSRSRSHIHPNLHPNNQTLRSDLSSNSIRGRTLFDVLARKTCH